MSRMQENFDLLREKVLDSLNQTNLEETRRTLSSIKTPIIVTGVGGSKVVAVFTSKILASKNGIISTCLEPRDMLYTTISGYDNVLSCSYSGTNFGVETLIRISEELQISTDWLIRAAVPEVSAIYHEELYNLIKDCDPALIENMLQMLRLMKKTSEQSQKNEDKY